MWCICEHVCVWCICEHVCGGKQGTIMDVIFQEPLPCSLRQGLSLAWDLPISLGWLGRELKGSTPQPPKNWGYPCGITTSGFFRWLLRLKFGSSYLQSKLITDQAISPAPKVILFQSKCLSARRYGTQNTPFL